MKINALIIASEITKGMKSIGSRSLLNICDNIKVIDQQIQSLKTIHKNIHITVACGYEHDKVSEHIKKYKNVDAIYNDQYRITNEAENLRLYFEHYADIENLFMINGGVLIKKNCRSYSNINKDKSIIFLLNGQKNNFELGCSNTKQIEYIFYDLEHTWSEFIFLSKNEISILRDYLIVNSNINQKYMFELINTVLNYNPIDKVFMSKRDVMKIASIQDIQKAKNFI